MTVICFDGTTLAADKLASDEWVKRTVTKIRRSHGGEAMIGAAGDSDRCRALLAWFAEGGEFPDHLRRSDHPGATLLVVWRSGTVELYQREPQPIVLSGKLQAIGSGSDAAMAAMLCGKTAAEAVEIASQVCRGVGNGVDTLRFEG